MPAEARVSFQNARTPSLGTGESVSRASPIVIWLVEFAVNGFQMTPNDSSGVGFL